MKLYLGVDGGQSSTTALVGDRSGAILGRATAGPCNHVGAELGRARLTNAMEQAVGGALRQAGGRWRETRLAGACLGMSGGPEDKREIIEELIPADNWEVTTDAHIALYGATSGKPGIVVIAGTGSIALGLAHNGKVARAGGWGDVFGDEGGGFDIVRNALRSVLQLEEGWGFPTALSRALLTETGASSANQLMHWFYRDDWPRDRVASLAQLIHNTAEAGDEVAVGVLQESGAELARLGAGVRQQLAGDEDYPLAPIGGVFESSTVLEAFRRALEAARCRVADACSGPAEGALQRAIDIARVQ